MILIFVGITLAYLFLIGSLAFGFDKVKPFILEEVRSKNNVFCDYSV